MNLLKIISIDELKKALPGYAPERADAFQEQSAKLANKLFEKELKSIQNEQLPIVLMCGGSASGKTEMIEKFLAEDFKGIVFDSTLATEEGAKNKLRAIRKSGNKPYVNLVIPAPYNDFSRSFHVFHGRERIIPEERFYQTHSGARKSALWIAEYCPDVVVRVFENSYDPHDTAEDMFPFTEIEFEKAKHLIEFLRGIQYTEDEIKSSLSDYA
jgi:hypothetical protein